MTRAPKTRGKTRITDRRVIARADINEIYGSLLKSGNYSPRLWIDGFDLGFYDKRQRGGFSQERGKFYQRA
jgi:hypothetical protein